MPKSKTQKAKKPNASDFVRSQSASMSAGDVVKAGAAAGYKFSPTLVYMVRRNANGGKAKKGKPGRKPRSATNGGSVSAFKKAALDLGLGQARAALDELERGLAALIG